MFPVCERHGEGVRHPPDRGQPFPVAMEGITHVTIRYAHNGAGTRHRSRRGSIVPRMTVPVFVAIAAVSGVMADVAGLIR